MMMNSLQRRRVRSRRRRFALLGAVVLAAVLFGASGLSSSIDFPEPVSSAATALARPLWQGGSAVGQRVEEFFGLLRSKRSLVIENRALKRELAERETALIANIALKEQNEELKRFLGRESSPSGKIAAVISREASSPYDTFFIDIGSADGVAGGDIVYGPEQSVLGTVDASFSNRARVQLFSAPGRETDVLIGDAAVEAVAIGKGGGNFEVRLPSGVGVAEGDAVVLPAFTPSVFGLVEEVVTEPSAPFDTVLFKNPVNTAGLRWVEVVPSGS